MRYEDQLDINSNMKVQKESILASVLVRYWQDEAKINSGTIVLFSELQIHEQNEFINMDQVFCKTASAIWTPNSSLLIVLEALSLKFHLFFNISC
jgi:hypothetical protein